VPSRGLLNPCSALAASFQWFDRWWADARCDPSLTEHGWDDSGSTAVVGLVSGQHLIVANAGEQGAVWCMQLPTAAQHGGLSCHATASSRGLLYWHIISLSSIAAFQLATVDTALMLQVKSLCCCCCCWRGASR
jgi:hypothetical protein